MRPEISAAPMPDRERDARAVDDAAEVVAAQRVGAERVFPRAGRSPDRFDQAIAEVLCVGIMRRDQRRKEGDHCDEQNPGTSQQKPDMAQRAAPHDLARRGRPCVERVGGSVGIERQRHCITTTECADRATR